MSPELSTFIDNVIVPNLVDLWLREQAEASRAPGLETPSPPIVAEAGRRSDDGAQVEAP